MAPHPISPRSPIVSNFAQAQPDDWAIFLKSTGSTVLRGAAVLL
jgi:hypothetical protein